MPPFSEGFQEYRRKQGYVGLGSTTSPVEGLGSPTFPMEGHSVHARSGKKVRARAAGDRERCCAFD